MSYLIQSRSERINSYLSLKAKSMVRRSLGVNSVVILVRLNSLGKNFSLHSNAKIKYLRYLIELHNVELLSKLLKISKKDVFGRQIRTKITKKSRVNHLLLCRKKFVHLTIWLMFLKTLIYLTNLVLPQLDLEKQSHKNSLWHLKRLDQRHLQVRIINLHLVISKLDMTNKRLKHQKTKRKVNHRNHRRPKSHRHWVNQVNKLVLRFHLIFHQPHQREFKLLLYRQIQL